MRCTKSSYNQTMFTLRLDQHYLHQHWLALLFVQDHPTQCRHLFTVNPHLAPMTCNAQALGCHVPCLKKAGKSKYHLIRYMKIETHLINNIYVHNSERNEPKTNKYKSNNLTKLNIKTVDRHYELRGRKSTCSYRTISLSSLEHANTVSCLGLHFVL